MLRHKSKFFRYRVDHASHDRLWQVTNSQAGQDLFVIAMTQGQRDLRFLEIGAGHPIGGNNTFLLEKKFDWSGLAIDLYDYTRDQTMTSEQWFEINWRDFYQAIRAPAWPQDPGPSIEGLPAGIQQELWEIHWYQSFEDTYLGTVCSWQSLRPRTDFLQQDVFGFEKFDDHYDYIQFDIEPSAANFDIAKKILSRTHFGVCTFEHDVWRNTDENYATRSLSRELMQDLGYQLLVNDVTFLPPERGRHDPNPINFEDWWIDPKVIDQDVISAYEWIDHSNKPKFFDDILFRT